MTTRKVAAAQLGPASSEKSETVARMVALLDEAGAQGVELLVFPELSLTPYFAAEVREDAASYAEAVFPSAVTAPLVEAVQRNAITTVVPLAEHVSGQLFNSAVLLDANGTELGRYRKMHIPGTVDVDPDKTIQILEKRYFVPGDLGFPAYPSAIGSVGMAICYDRRFPETFRCLGLSGAEFFAVVFNTPFDSSEDGAQAKAIEAHELAVRSAALYNGVPAIAAGKAGVEGGVSFIGGSSVISHTGEVLARSTSDGDDLVVAELDLDEAEQARTRLALSVNRRTDEYGAITEPVGAAALVAG